MKKIFSFFLAIALCMPMANGAVKVHTIGDSTMESYDESTTDKRGWATYLGSFFDSQYVTVNNRGKSGSDTRRFYTNAAYWQSVKSQMSAGETLHVRLLPWHEHTSGSGKYICLYNLKIEGQAFEPKQEGIRTTQSVTPATKILRDGRLYILRNGVEYHVTGQRK